MKNKCGVIGSSCVVLLTMVAVLLYTATVSTSVYAQVAVCESCAKLRSEFDTTTAKLTKIKTLIGQNEAYLLNTKDESKIIKVKSNVMLLSLQLEANEVTMKAVTGEAKSSQCKEKCGIAFDLAGG